MEGITKIVGIIIAILLILVAGYFGRGFIERGVGIAQGILGKSGTTAEQTLESMNQDIILSMTKFTVTIKEEKDTTGSSRIVDSTTIIGYNALLDYLKNYGIDVTSLTQEGGDAPLIPDTLMNLYQSKCGGSEVGGSLEEVIKFTGTGLGDNSDYSITVIVTLPECES